MATSQDPFSSRKRKPPDRPPDRPPNLFDQISYPTLSLEAPNIWQKNDIFQRHLVISSTDETKDVSNISPFKIAKELKKTGSIQDIKKQRNKTIFVQANNKTTSDALQKLTQLGDVPIKITPHKTLNFSKGVIRSAELKGCSEEEMVSELKDQGVTDAKNITLKKHHDTIKTNTWILTFNLPFPPQEIKIPCFASFKVAPYIPKPMVCSICFRLGHTKARCKHYIDLRCETCGEENHLIHSNLGKRPGESEDTIVSEPGPCPYENTGWCPNCKETGHWPQNSKCKMYALTQKILKYKATHGGTFAEIKKMFTQQNPEDYAHVVQRQTQNTNAKHQNRSNVQKNQATKNPKEQKATSESNNKDLESKSPKPKKSNQQNRNLKFPLKTVF